MNVKNIATQYLQKRSDFIRKIEKRNIENDLEGFLTIKQGLEEKINNFDNSAGIIEQIQTVKYLEKCDVEIEFLRHLLNIWEE